MLSLLYLSVCIEDFDPLCGHEQIDLSSGRSLSVGALHSRRETSRKEVKQRKQQVREWVRLSRAIKSNGRKQGI